MLYKIHCKNREKVRYHVGCCGKSNTEKDLQQSLYPRTNKPITTLNHYRIWANFYECKSTSKSISYNYLQLSINNTNATVNVQTHGRRNSTLTASTGPPYSLPLYISHASLGVRRYLKTEARDGEKSVSRGEGSRRSPYHKNLLFGKGNGRSPQAR